MRSAHLLMSAVHFLFAVGVLFFSVFFLLVAHDPLLRSSFFQFFQQENRFVTVGVSGLVVSFSLFTGLYWIHRRHFYQVKMDHHRMEIDSALIKKYVQSFWEEYLPHSAIESDVVIHSEGELEIVACLKNGSSDPIYSNLQQIEKQLGAVLSKKVGYKKEFLLTVVYP